MLLIGLLYNTWPALLLGAVAMLAVAYFARTGLRRAGAVAVACVLGFGALLGVMFVAMQRQSEARLAAHYATRGTRLDAETVIEGVAFPPGTEVVWTASQPARFIRATMPRPTGVLGVSAVRATLAEEGWVLEPDRPQEVSGWPCDGSPVTLGPDGALRSCDLSRQVEWHGWTLPAATRVKPRGAGGGLGIFLPYAMVLFAREIDRPLPPEVSLNADGSFDGTEFHLENPMVVRGTPLINQVRWRYAPATLGMGRDRPPVAVEGVTLPVPLGNGLFRPGERVVVRLSDGVVTGAATKG